MLKFWRGFIAANWLLVTGILTITSLCYFQIVNFRDICRIKITLVLFGFLFWCLCVLILWFVLKSICIDLPYPGTFRPLFEVKRPIPDLYFTLVSVENFLFLFLALFFNFGFDPVITNLQFGTFHWSNIFRIFQDQSCTGSSLVHFQLLTFIAPPHPSRSGPAKKPIFEFQNFGFFKPYGGALSDFFGPLCYLWFPAQLRTLKIPIWSSPWFFGHFRGKTSPFGYFAIWVTDPEYSSLLVIFWDTFCPWRF